MYNLPSRSRILLVLSNQHRLFAAIEYLMVKDVPDWNDSDVDYDDDRTIASCIEFSLRFALLLN